MSELDLTSVAERTVWFKSPKDTLQDNNFFLAYVMTSGTLRDITAVLESFSQTDFEAVLDDPPSGVSISAPGISGTFATIANLLPPCPRDEFPKSLCLRNCRNSRARAAPNAPLRMNKAPAVPSPLSRLG